jgi:hypothetical protein
MQISHVPAGQPAVNNNSLLYRQNHDMRWETSLLAKNPVGVGWEAQVPGRTRPGKWAAPGKAEKRLLCHAANGKKSIPTRSVSEGRCHPSLRLRFGMASVAGRLSRFIGSGSRQASGALEAWLVSLPVNPMRAKRIEVSANLAWPLMMKAGPAAFRRSRRPHQTTQYMQIGRRTPSPSRERISQCEHTAWIGNCRPRLSQVNVG